MNPKRNEGVLEEARGRWRLRFVRRLAHPREKVWRALTEEQHLSAWFPTTIEGELRAGAPLRFAFRGGDYPAHSGRMVEYDPPAVMEFEWGEPEQGEDEDHEVTRIELVPDGDGCVLTLLTTYDRLGKSARDAAGWHVCLDLLEDELSGTTPGGATPERWKPLERLYAERFGPDAATIGPPQATDG
ncbi:MAG TPA: SRPBCC domain-containing protein [Longimicrobiales bacterium]